MDKRYGGLSDYLLCSFITLLFLPRKWFWAIPAVAAGAMVVRIAPTPIAFGWDRNIVRFFIAFLGYMWNSFLSAIGTTGLGFFTNNVEQFFALEAVTWIGIWVVQGKVALLSHKRKNVLFGAVLYLTAITIVYLPIYIRQAWKVRVEIETQANEHHVAPRFSLPLVPVNGLTKTPTAALAPAPKVKEWAVSFAIPFVKGGQSQGIPFNNLKTSTGWALLDQTYADLAALDNTEIAQDFDPYTRMYAPVPDTLAISFGGEALRYFILRSVAEMQEPSTMFSFDSERGGVSNTPAAVPVPNAQLYPRKNLEEILTKTKFADSTRVTRMNHQYVERRAFWEQKHFAVPRGSSIEITSDGWFIAKPKLYKLEFSVHYMGKNTGVLPPHFYPIFRVQNPDLLELMFNVNIHFEWYGKYDEADPYVDWASGLASGLEARLKQD